MGKNVVGTHFLKVSPRAYYPDYTVIDIGSNHSFLDNFTKLPQARQLLENSSAHPQVAS